MSRTTIHKLDALFKNGLLNIMPTKLLRVYNKWNRCTSEFRNNRNKKLLKAIIKADENESKTN